MAELTNNIILAKDEFSKQLYFMEDVEDLIDKLKECIANKKTDTEKTVRSKLVKIFKLNKVKCERDFTPDQYKQALDSSSIPSVYEFPELCWEEMLELNIVYKSPEAYIKRLVDNLVYPEFNKSDVPVRVKILRQFLGNMSYLQGTRFYSRRLVEIIKQDYKGVIADIDDEIFNKYLTSKHSYKPHKLIKVILDVFGDVIYREGEYDDTLSALVCECDNTVEEKTAVELVAFLKENNFFKPSLTERIADHLGEVLGEYKAGYDAAVKNLTGIKHRTEQFKAIAEFICERNLVQKILTDEFIALVNRQTGAWIKTDMDDNRVIEILSAKADESPRAFAKINSEIISVIRKFISERNREFKRRKDNIKDHSDDFEILHICNDLADGKFGKVAETKEILYLFAFAFDMSARADKTKKDDFKYIRKNLFEDFYCDNIIRYINDYHKVGVYDEPTGISIQYKNFAEVVYLYWLNKDSNEISPYQKYMKAGKMIEDIVSEYKAAEKTVAKATEKNGAEYFDAKKIADKKEKGTFVYRYYFEGTKGAIKKYGNYTSEKGILLEMDEQALAKFIIENYNIDTQRHYKGAKTTEAFENQSHQSKAVEVFNCFITEIKEKEQLPLIEYFYELDFYKSISEYEQNKVLKHSDEHKRLSKLVKKVNEQIRSVLEDIETNGNNKFTRTRLMYLYYIWFINDRIGSDSKEYMDTFDDFCDEYCEQLNENLELCSYQLFSEKNLIDVMLLFSAFITLRTEY